MKWYSQLPNTISISQTHPKRNLRCKIDYKHKQVKATPKPLCKLWLREHGMVMYPLQSPAILSSWSALNFIVRILCTNCDSLEILQFSPFCATTFLCHGNICFSPVSDNWTLNNVPKSMPSHLDWSAFNGCPFHLSADITNRIIEGIIDAPKYHL